MSDETLLEKGRRIIGEYAEVWDGLTTTATVDAAALRAVLTELDRLTRVERAMDPYWFRPSPE